MVSELVTCIFSNDGSKGLGFYFFTSRVDHKLLMQFNLTEK